MQKAIIQQIIFKIFEDDYAHRICIFKKHKPDRTTFSNGRTNSNLF
jgi:hypothetical protein